MISKDLQKRFEITLAKIPIDENSAGAEFQFRVGSEIFGPGVGWKGRNTEASPQNLLPNELLVATNVRLRGGDILSRPPLTEVVDLRSYGPFLSNISPTDAQAQFPIFWMHPEAGGNPRYRLWMSSLKCQGVGSLGATIFHVDPTEDPVLQIYASFPAGADRTIRMFKYGIDLFIGNASQLLQIILQPGTPGLNSRSVIPAPSVLPLYTFTGYEIGWGKEFDGLLFLGLTHLTSPNTLSKIVSWNGLSPTDEVTGIRATRAAEVLADRLIVGCDSTDALVRIRASGDAPGSWSTSALAGFSTGTDGNVMQEFRDSVLIVDGATKVFKLVGTTLSLIHTAAASVLSAITLHEDLIYYARTVGGTNAYIGRYDPDSNIDAAHEWIDSYKNLTTDQPTFTDIRSLTSYNRRLWCGGSNGMIVATPVGNPIGAVTVFNPASSNGVIGPIPQMLRF